MSSAANWTTAAVAAVGVLVASCQLDQANDALNANNAYAAESDLTDAAFRILTLLAQTDPEPAAVEDAFLELDFRVEHVAGLADNDGLRSKTWHGMLNRLCGMFGPDFGRNAEGDARLPYLKSHCPAGGN